MHDILQVMHSFDVSEIEKFHNTGVQNRQSSTSAIQDYYAGSLKLRVASSNLWYISHPGVDLPGFLLSTAHSLFQQVDQFFL